MRKIEPPSGQWAFKVGQCISHKDQSMPSLVMGRTRASNGMEFYGVRSFATVDPNRDRMMLGDFLVNVAPGDTGTQHLLFLAKGVVRG